MVGVHIFMILACSVGSAFELQKETLKDTYYFFRVIGANSILDNALSLLMSAIITNIIWVVDEANQQEEEESQETQKI